MARSVVKGAEKKVKRATAAENPAKFTHKQRTLQEGQDQELAETKSVMKTGRRSKNGQGKVQSSGSSGSAHRRTQKDKKKDSTGKRHCHQPQEPNFEMPKRNELKRRLRLKDGSRTRLNQQSMKKAEEKSEE